MTQTIAFTTTWPRLRCAWRSLYTIVASVRRMIRISDEQTFRRALAEPQAMLVLHAQWSGSSMFALKSVEKWDRERQESGNFASVALFIAEHPGDAYPAPVVAWLKAQGLE